VSAIFKAKLLSKNAWPSTEEKNIMVDDAITEANEMAFAEGRRQSQFMTSGKGKVSLRLSQNIGYYSLYF
jgi:hypothetical protein